MARSGIMLCYPFEEARLEKWPRPWILQPKLDGDRCRAILDADGVCTLLSSEENEIESVPHINWALQGLGLTNVELDGELYIHGALHQDIHSIVSREVNLHPDYEAMEYHVFDIVNGDPQLKRTRDLINLITSGFGSRCTGPIQLVPSIVVDTVEEVMSQLAIYQDKAYEGFVIRDISAPYMRKRSARMMKFKPRKNDLYEIVGWQEEISISGTPKHALGALWCSGNNGTRFKVGSGPALTREQRISLWNHREALIGQYAEVFYQHLTKGGVPRFPILAKVISPSFL